MKNIFKIAIRNLQRYKRRTLLTSLLIILGVVMVVVFSGISKSFKEMMIGTITDSMMGHLQIHKKGYVSSIDNLPLHLNLNDDEINSLKSLLDEKTNIDLSCFWSSKDGHGGPLLSQQQSSKLAKFDIDFWYDLY